MFRPTIAQTEISLGEYLKNSQSEDQFEKLLNIILNPVNSTTIQKALDEYFLYPTHINCALHLIWLRNIASRTQNHILQNTLKNIDKVYEENQRRAKAIVYMPIPMLHSASCNYSYYPNTQDQFLTQPTESYIGQEFEAFPQFPSYQGTQNQFPTQLNLSQELEIPAQDSQTEPCLVYVNNASNLLNEPTQLKRSLESHQAIKNTPKRKKRNQKPKSPFINVIDMDEQENPIKNIVEIENILSRNGKGELTEKDIHFYIENKKDVKTLGETIEGKKHAILKILMSRMKKPISTLIKYQIENESALKYFLIKSEPTSQNLKLILNYSMPEKKECLDIFIAYLNNLKSEKRIARFKALFSAYSELKSEYSKSKRHVMNLPDIYDIDTFTNEEIMQHYYEVLAGKNAVEKNFNLSEIQIDWMHCNEPDTFKLRSAILESNNPVLIDRILYLTQHNWDDFVEKTPIQERDYYFKLLWTRGYNGAEKSNAFINYLKKHPEQTSAIIESLESVVSEIKDSNPKLVPTLHLLIKKLKFNDLEYSNYQKNANLMFNTPSNVDVDNNTDFFLHQIIDKYYDIP